jgi:hypothetical protein
MVKVCPVNDRLKVFFTVLAENRKEPFTESMEKASVYCFTEFERENGGGLILKSLRKKPFF